MKSQQKAFVFAFLWACLFCVALPNGSFSATGKIDLTKKYQTIEGFGGGLVFGVTPYGRTNKDELYDSLFNKAGVNMVRIENLYGHTDTGIQEVPMMKEIQQKWPQVKVILTGWSPPKNLKTNDTTAGKSKGSWNSIKKNGSSFMYDEYGDWWMKSARYFDSCGVNVNWISIQNEPNWPADWRGCYLDSIETSSLASYGKALNAVYTKLKTLTKSFPLVGPDLTGLGPDNMLGTVTSKDGITMQNYMKGDLHADQLVARCHHYYNGADSGIMATVGKLYSDKPLYQTEFLYNEGQPWPSGSSKKYWFDHAQLIQSGLVDEGLSAYLIFALTYKVASTHCCFSLDSTNPSAFTVRPIYYAFKQFSKSIHRGWTRVDAGIDESGLKISAFANTSEDSLAVIVVNSNSTSTTMTLSLPQEFAKTSLNGEIYQTTESPQTRGEIVKKYSHEGSYSVSKAVAVAARSITTIELSNVPATGIGLTTGLKRKMDIISIERVTANAHGDIAVSYHMKSSEPFMLSLFDMNGKKISSMEHSGNKSGTTTYVFKGPLAAGCYTIRLDSNDEVSMRHVVVARSR